MSTDLAHDAPTTTKGIYFSNRLGCWVVGSYREAVEVLRSDAFVIEPSPRWQQGDEHTLRAIAPLRELETRIPPYATGAKHRRLRDGLRLPLTTAATQARRPRIREITTALVEARLAAGKVEVVEEICRPLLRTVMAELVGIPDKDRDAFDRMVASREKFGLYGTPQWTPEVQEEVLTADRQIGRYLRGLMATPDQLPEDCFLTIALAGQGPHGGLSEAEIVTNTHMLYATGVVTTMLLLGSAAYFLLRDETVLAAVREDPTVVAAVVKETLRFATPTVEVNARHAVRDTTIGGRLIRRGDVVRVMALRASRDPDQFPDPDTFDHRRATHKPLAFGLGPHTCSGNHLSIAIAEELCTVLADPRYGARITGPTPVLRRALSIPVVWGIDQLHLRLDPTTDAPAPAIPPGANTTRAPAEPPPSADSHCPFTP